MIRLLFSIVLVAAAWWFVSITAAQSNASIQIVKPLDRRNVPDKNAQVKVQITGVAPKDGHYWELWVDDEPVVGARNGEQTVTVSFKPTGPHRLKAVLFDAQGKQLAASKVILVTAAPVDERKLLFNRELMAPFMAGFVVFTAVLLIISVWFRRSRRSEYQIFEESES